MEEEEGAGEVKSACMVSSTRRVSAEMSRKTGKIFARELYRHDFCLSREQQVEGEESELGC